MTYTHVFFDMDKTIAPPRQPIVPEMYELLSRLPVDVIVVSGQLVEKIKWQSNTLPALYLGNNGNHAVDRDGTELWQEPPLSAAYKKEIHDHINAIVAHYKLELNHDWTPIEDRGSQITFSPIGNTAPVEIKMAYDPDRKKRDDMLATIPFLSEELMVKIGGSTSLDYIHKKQHKGVNVARLIALKGWDKTDCVYFGDGLYPGGNDELVIGVIDTISVTDHLDTYQKVREMFPSVV